MNKQYYIVRGEKSGVFFGQIAERNGREVTLRNARRLWYWDGATECCQIAAEGVKRPGNCKFTITVEEVVLLDAIELHPCTEKATKIISEVATWKK